MANLRAGIWQIGVAAPVQNPKFRYGYELSGTLQSDVASGATTLTVDAKTVVPGWNQVYRVGDFVKVGPSTHVDNPGAIEWVELDGASNGTLTIDSGSATQFKYSSGDAVSGIGSRLPRKWYAWDRLGSHAWALANNVPDGIYDDRSTNITREQGVSDKYFFDSGTWIDRAVLYYQGVAADLQPNTRYRCGFYYKVSSNGIGSAPSYSFGVDDGTTTFMTDIFISAHDVEDWTGYQFAPTTPDTETAGTDGMTNAPGSISAFSITIGYATSWAGATGHLDLDHFYLCHALDTSDQSEGMYNFTWFPDRGSVRWQDHIDTKQVTDGMNISRPFDPTGRMARHDRKSVSCSFTHTPAAMYENLKALEWWQDQGYSLVLKFNDTRLGSKYPPVMIGKVRLTGYSRNHWDVRRVSFNFSFTED